MVHIFEICYVFKWYTSNTSLRYIFGIYCLQEIYLQYLTRVHIWNLFFLQEIYFCYFTRSWNLYLFTTSRPSQCSTTGVTKTVVCIILSVGWCIQKEPLLLIGKSSLCGGSRFPLSLSEWSFTICPTPYNRKWNVLSVSLNKTFPPPPVHDIHFLVMGERERNVLFNDTLNTFYLRLYGVKHMVKDRSDSEKGTRQAAT